MTESVLSTLMLLWMYVCQGPPRERATRAFAFYCLRPSSTLVSETFARLCLSVSLSGGVKKQGNSSTTRLLSPVHILQGVEPDDLCKVEIFYSVSLACFYCFGSFP